MSCSDKTATLARQTELESEPNGAPRLHWGPWLPSVGACALDLQFDVARMPASAILRLRAQKSVDGVSGEAVGPADSGGFVDGTDAGITVDDLSTSGKYSFQYTGTPQDYQGFLRFGLQVEGSGDVVQVQLSATATLRATPRPQVLSGTAASVTAGTEATLLQDVPVASFSKVRAFVDFTTAPGAGTLDVNVYSGVGRLADGAVQVKIATAQLTGAYAFNGSVEASALGQYLTVKLFGSGAWTTQDVAGSVQLRAE